MEHDPFGKPVSTFPDDALADGTGRSGLLSVSQGSNQRPHGHKDDDQRPHGPERRARFVCLRGEIGREVQKSADDITIEQHAGEQKRGLVQHVKEAGHQEKRNILEVIELDAPDAVDVLVGFKLLWIGKRIEQVFRKSSGGR